MINLMKKNNIFFFGIIFLLLLFLFFLYSLFEYDFNFDSVVFLFIVNSLIYLIGIFFDKRTVSINKIYNYFMLIFMAIAPFIQYISGYYSRGYILSKNDYIRSNLFLLLRSIVYLFSFIFFYVRKKKNIDMLSFNSKPKEINKGFYFIIFVFSIVVFVYSLLVIGFNNLMVRGDNHFDSNSIFDIVIDFLLRFVPTCTLAFYVLKNKKNILDYFLILFLIIFVFILNNPVSNSRFNTAAVLFCIIIPIIYSSKLKRFNRLLDISILVGVLFLFPLLNYFKRFTFGEFLNLDISYNLFDSFNTVDFDAFSFIARGLQFVDTNGLQYGKQIISTLFFFIPRAILPIKGEITGSLIVNTQTPGMYDNVSCPLMTEIYIDFGFIGVILFAIFLAYIFNVFDKNFNRFNSSHFFVIGYSIFLGYQIYLLRGSLASTFLRLMGSLLPLFIFYLIFAITYKFIKSVHHGIN